MLPTMLLCPQKQPGFRTARRRVGEQLHFTHWSRAVLPPPRPGPAHGDKAADASSSRELAELCTLPGSSRRLCRDHKGPAFQLGKGVSWAGPGEGAGTGLAPAAFCSAQSKGAQASFWPFPLQSKKK